MHHLARTVVPGAVRHLLPRTPKRVVVLGGGPTGLYCADRLRHHFEVTLVDCKEFFEFTPGILRALADPAHLSRITFDYRDVLERSLGVEFVLGTARGISAPPPEGGPSRASVTVETSAPGGGVAQGLRRLGFDYCVVAVGVSNGIWKPRSPGEAPWPQWAARSAAERPTPAANAGGGGADAVDVDERLLRERIAGSRGVVVVGAGLVGVELAAELCHFFPRLRVTLLDGAPNVLPQLAEGAREYARTWLQQHGVKLKLGTPFVPESVGDDQMVLWCVGTCPRSSGLFDDATVLRPNGQIRVNRRMQVLRRASPMEGASPVELEPLGQGRVFAVGDAAAVEGVPMAQMIFHGEEMAAVAVANVEAAEDIASPLALGRGRREAEPGQPLLCCTSLGPQDGTFSTQSELVATGGFAALQKQLIEETKMSALRGELLGSLLWMPVH